MATSLELAPRPHRRTARRPIQGRRKHRVFLTVNAIVLACISAATLTNPYARTDTAVYVALLSIVCTAPLLFATSYRGHSSLLIIFLAYYFATFGLSDLVQLFIYQPTAYSPTALPSRGGSLAILVGAACFIIGYTIVTHLRSARNGGWSAREWAPKAAAQLGVTFWAIGWTATAALQFGGGDPNSGQLINPAIGGFLALIRILLPVGSLLLIYLFLTTRSRKLLTILLATMALDGALGFFGGSKNIAMQVPVLFLLSIVLLREKIPVITLIAFTLVTAVLFNVFQDYRNAVWNSGESRGAAMTQVLSRKDNLLPSTTPLETRLTSGLDYFLSRISQRRIIDLIVDRTGKSGVRFQEGATLAPLLYIFIPRLIAPDKPNSIIGRLFNHTFSIASKNTFIAATNLGDLYWNFGWAGIVIGMALIGMVMAWAATEFRLDINPTLPKFLFLVITIFFLILKFEEGIALVYTLWARTAVLLLLIHSVVPKAKLRLYGKHGPNCEGRAGGQ